MIRDSILKVISEETGGDIYSTGRYCIDDFSDAQMRARNVSSRKINFKKRGETRNTTEYVNLKPAAEQLSTENESFFSYFLDGSRHVYKIADVGYDSTVYPIVAGQIGVGFCARENKVMSAGKCVMKNYIVLPAAADKDGRSKDPFKKLLSRVQDYCAKLPLGICFDEILRYSVGKEEDALTKATALIQDKMIQSELATVKALVEAEEPNDKKYLIKDGSLEYPRQSEKNQNSFSNILNHFKFVVGVSKSFNADLAEMSDKSRASSIIANLPLYSRTPAYRYAPERVGEEFAVWYVRIRETRLTQSPFDGVLKIEKVLWNEEEKRAGLDSDTINTLSASLINERNPCCYGSDTRWANHIYPVYITERYIKSHYLSPQVFTSIF